MNTRYGVFRMFFLLILLVGCTNTPPAQKVPSTPSVLVAMERLTFAGSTTVQPLAEKLAKAYRDRNPSITLEVGAGGSRVGIEAIKNGTADIGMVSRELKSEEKTSGMENYQIAIDVLAMIVHPSNKISNLTLKQLREIYTGKITNWKDVGGDDIAIIPMIRDVSSGTRGAFDEIALAGEKPIETETNTRITAGEIHQSVAESKGAIGYVGFGHLSGSDVKVITIDGVAPGVETAQNGTYKLKRPLQMLIGPLSRPEAKKFIEFVLSPEGQKLVIEDGWIATQQKDRN